MSEPIKFNYCFNCGDEVESGNYELIGSQRFYVCGEMDCNRELSRECRAYEEELAERAREDGYDRYR